MPVLTYVLLLANILGFALEIHYGDALIEAFALWPIGAGFTPWQIVTSAFLHGGLAHLASNMFGLWMFGRGVERELGSARFATLYAVSLVVASLAQLVVSTATSTGEPTLGASGAIFGVLAAFAVLFPGRKIILLFPPLILPARVFVALYAAFELFAGFLGFESDIAHIAHLGGLAAGVVLALRWRRNDEGLIGGRIAPFWLD